MTLKNNRAPHQCHFKLCASFHSHWWIQTGVTVRKPPNWVLTSVTFDLIVKNVWQTDGRTDRQTGGRTESFIELLHWGWTHEGVGRHPRQDGGGLFHRLGYLQANLRTRCIHWRPILLEIIAAGVRNTEAEFQVVIGSHSAVILTWKVAWWRGWCTFQFSRCRGWLFSMSRVTPRWTRVTLA